MRRFKLFNLKLFSYYTLPHKHYYTYLYFLNLIYYRLTSFNELITIKLYIHFINLYILALFSTLSSILKTLSQSLIFPMYLELFSPL
jgi:hypothetical protein